MKADEKRQAVARKYDELIGRNHYSQPLRDYCYRKHSDGNYYSDCSSSICYAYKEAGYGFGILNTAGIYQSARLVTVDVPIRDGQVRDIGQLRVGDMLEFAGTDESRPQTIGHVEMVHTLDGEDTIICGHEMCIRDRHHRKHDDRRARKQPEGHHAAEGGELPGTQEGGAAVGIYRQAGP